MAGDEARRVPPARRGRCLAAEAILRFVAVEGWKAEVLEDGTVVTKITGDHGQWACMIIPVADLELVVIESLAPLAVPPGKFRPIAELLALINEDLQVGGFVVDRDSGAVRFRVTVDVEALEGAVGDPALLAARMIASPVSTSNATMDRWLAAIAVVVHGDTAPSEAVAAILARG